MSKAVVIALDLEGTLISNAYHCEPRPGLFEFARFCLDRFERLAVFTAVPDDVAREIVENLMRSEHLPAAFGDRYELIVWDGATKDLSFVPGVSPEEVLLVDDDPDWIDPAQEDRWIAIEPYHGGADDTELARVRELLEKAA